MIANSSCRIVYAGEDADIKWEQIKDVFNSHNGKTYDISSLNCCTVSKESCNRIGADFPFSIDERNAGVGTAFKLNPLATKFGIPFAQVEEAVPFSDQMPTLGERLCPAAVVLSNAPTGQKIKNIAVGAAVGAACTIQ